MKNKTKDRIGEITYTKYNEYIKIIEYNGYSDMVVKFDNGFKIRTTYQHFKEGTIKNPYRKILYGIGYIGEGKFNKRSYQCWKNMFKRCYDDEYKKLKPTYDACVVCDKWHNYSNFSKWFEENYYKIENETMCLDKDILVKGNKIYSPETCIFVPNKINCLFTKSNSSRGKYPIGVNYNVEINKYQSRCSNGLGESISLGYFKTPEDAFEVYKINKENIIKKISDEYKDKIPQKLYVAMLRYEVEITD